MTRNQKFFRPITELLLGDYHGAVFVSKNSQEDLLLQRLMFKNGVQYSYPINLDGLILPVEKQNIIEFQIVEHVENYWVLEYDEDTEKVDIVEVNHENKYEYIPNFMTYQLESEVGWSGYLPYRTEADMQLAMDYLAKYLEGIKDGSLREAYDGEELDDHFDDDFLY